MSIVVATSSGTIYIDQQRVHILQGTAWAADSPAVLEHPDMFSTDPNKAFGLDLEPKAGRRHDTPVEQKTAAPGEVSNARKPRLFSGR